MQRMFVIVLLLWTAAGWTQNSMTRWYKGNTHTHSYWSDGDDFPEMIMDWYKTHGYHFISLSDHNILAEGVKWKPLPAHPFRQRRFNEYLQRFGKDWVVYKTDSAGRISVQLKTLEQYRTLFEEKGKFLIMQAEEITDAYQGKPLHIGAVNVKELIQPRGGNSVTEVLQHNLDAVYEQRRKTGQPMFPHINHPNFQWAVKLEDMIPLTGERFFEVYNGHPHVHNYGDSATIGMEELWDKLQLAYLKAGKPLLYGLATDDSHHYLEFKVGLSNPGRGWIMVRAEELTPAALLAAMETGAFYATTGVELADVKTEGRTLKVVVQERAGTTYRIEFWGARQGGREGKLLKEVRGTDGAYTLKKEDLFVRAKIISSQLQENPFQQGDYESAWTQPVTAKE